MSVQKKIMRVAANVHSALYRRSSSFRRTAGLPVLLLTVKGRRSGKELTTPVTYLEHEGGFAVTGTAGGDSEEPQWFRNLRAASRAAVQVGDATHEVDVRVAKGAERDALWQRFVREGTTFAKYETKTDRRFPVAILTPR